MKTALITGIAGQDGSYLAELLLTKGYRVHGLTQSYSKSQDFSPSRIAHFRDQIQLHVGDVGDSGVIREIVMSVRPDEIYHLAAKHEVGIAGEDYREVRRVNTDSTMYFLHEIRKIHETCKLFYASSCNIFGPESPSPQNEKTVFNPYSLYSISKVMSMHLIQMFRQEQRLFACSGILYNHESPRRDLFFLPRKITSTAVKIKLGLEKELVLGDIDARRDWGFAGDFVEAMWLMLQAKEPQDFIIGTGETYSVRNVLDMVFGVLEMDWGKYVRISQQFIRPKQPCERVADISKIKMELGWAPKTKFHDVLKMMIAEDLKIAQGGI